MQNVRSIMHMICGKGKRWQQTHKIIQRVTQHRRQLGMRAYVKLSHGNALHKPALDKRNTIESNKEICESIKNMALIWHISLWKHWSMGLFRYRTHYEIKIPEISQLLLLNDSFHHRHPHERNKVLRLKICFLKFQCVLLLSSPCRPTMPLSTTRILKAIQRNILSIHSRRSLYLFWYNVISSKVMFVKQ